MAQLPALGVLLVLLVFASRALMVLGDASAQILTDNYRSVLAAQRMKEAAERLDSAALFRLAGRDAEAAALYQTYQPLFEAELSVAERNLTEVGEPEATTDLRADWNAYLQSYARFITAAPEQRTNLYFDTLYPEFLAIKADAEQILALNQDAMVRKSDDAATTAAAVRRQVWIVGLLGLLGAALTGLWVSRRLAEPYQRLAEGAERVGAGDLEVRVAERGDQEAIAVAEAFNRMTQRLRAYRRASETEVVRAREAAQAAIDSLLDPVLVLAVGGELRLANRAAVTTLELAPRSRSIKDTALYERLRALCKAVEADGVARLPTDYADVIVLPTPAGERALLPHAVPMNDPMSGALIGITLLLQDVTRLRRLDMLKGDLVHTVAHELRTPLTSLGMALHLALDPRVSGPLPPTLIELLGAAREDVQRLKTLIDDLLDLSRIQEGRMTLRTDAFSAADLVADVCATWASAAASQGLTLRPLAAAVPMQGDRARLTVAVGNLVANALRASPPHTEVTVQAQVIDEQIQFDVTDHGPGIPPQLHDRLFGRFESHTTGGVGLGLYIAREIVRAHGGTVGAENVPQGGARVWLRLPRWAA